MPEKQHEDRLIHVACDVPPQVFGPLLLLLHDCRVENLQTIIPERGTAQIHHKQALALPKPRQRAADRPWSERLAQRRDVRQRLLAALNEHPDGITAADVRAKYFPDYNSTLTVGVPLDRLHQEGILDRSPDRPHSYWLKQAAAKPEKSATASRGVGITEAIISALRQHPAGLSVAEAHKVLGEDRYPRHQVGNNLGRLWKRGSVRRVGSQAKGFTYLPGTAS